MKHFMIMLITLFLAVFLLGACVPVTASPALQQSEAADPLPSWNLGPTKSAILSS